MKQVLVISGKGGTGKTIVTSALASIVKNKVMVDCDVDAADLHILLQPSIKERHAFMSGYSATIDSTKCIQCGACARACRFDAIGADLVEGKYQHRIDHIACEGCGYCSVVCPMKAVTVEEAQAGEWYVSDTRFGPMVHAALGVAEENSGKLVAHVRKIAQQHAARIQADWIIIDGPPGIGCPVIASLSSIDMAIIITEPTISGLHDADRVIQVARHFNVPVSLVINKYDLNEDMTQRIASYCVDNDIVLLGKIPFRKTVVEALMKKKTIIEFGDEELIQKMNDIWNTVKNKISEKG